MVKSIRLSSLDRIMACPASAKKPEGKRIESDNEGARNGTATHAIMAGIILNNLDFVGDIEKHCLEAGTENLQEVRFLSWAALRCWQDICNEYEPRTLCVEQGLTEDLGDGYELTGHPDWVGINDDGYLIVWDLKTGRTKRPCVQQLTGGAFLAAGHYAATEQFDEAIIIPAWVRFEPEPPKHITQAKLAQWHKDLMDTFRSDEYRPGSEQCLWCPTRWTCGARQAMMSSFATELVPLEGKSKILATPETMANALPHIQLMKGIIKDYEVLLKELVDENIEAGNDGIVCEHGLLTFKVTRPEKVDFDLGYPHIADAVGFSREKNDMLKFLGDAVSIAKGRLTKIVGKSAPKGKGVERVAKMMAALKEAGAVSESVSKSFVFKDKEIEQSGPQEL